MSLYIGGTWSAELGCVRRVVRTLGSLYVDRLTCFRVSALAKHLAAGHIRSRMGNGNGAVAEACSCDREGWGVEGRGTSQGK